MDQNCVRRKKKKRFFCCSDGFYFPWKNKSSNFLFRSFNVFQSISQNEQKVTQTVLTCVKQHWPHPHFGALRNEIKEKNNSGGNFLKRYKSFMSSPTLSILFLKTGWAFIVVHSVLYEPVWRVYLQLHFMHKANWMVDLPFFTEEVNISYVSTDSWYCKTFNVKLFLPLKCCMIWFEPEFQGDTTGCVYQIKTNLTSQCYKASLWALTFLSRNSS